MKMIILKILLIISIYCSCSNSSDESGANIDSVPQKVGIFANSHNPSGSVEHTYYYSNDTIEQTIKIQRKGENEIMFDYRIRNKKSNCEENLNGLAINKRPDSDPELDEDEDGFGYPSIEYIYQNKSSILAIRISMIEEDKVRIKASGFKDSVCPFESQGILRLPN